ncbi:hypothetical protein ES319_D07G075700v1 [Gossypium barbadense]|uniref:Uncharacterized protein n=1 Tax=Gossypium barbadense TaxID=3634 RepID=A0A5J5QNN3_GOSBA|nr:hypothetical protein ES319_D07G075700v1 [Gossypium barbadense]
MLREHTNNTLRVEKFLGSVIVEKVTAIKTEGSATPKTPGKSKRPHCFPAGTRALTRSQDFLDLYPFWVRAISYRFAPDINRWQAEALVAIQECVIASY